MLTLRLLLYWSTVYQAWELFDSNCRGKSHPAYINSPFLLFHRCWYTANPFGCGTLIPQHCMPQSKQHGGVHPRDVSRSSKKANSMQYHRCYAQVALNVELMEHTSFMMIMEPQCIAEMDGGCWYRKPRRYCFECYALMRALQAVWWCNLHHGCCCESKMRKSTRNQGALSPDDAKYSAGKRMFSFNCWGGQYVRKEKRLGGMIPRQATQSCPIQISLLKAVVKLGTYRQEITEGDRLLNPRLLLNWIYICQTWEFKDRKCRGKSHSSHINSSFLNYQYRWHIVMHRPKRFGCGTLLPQHSLSQTDQQGGKPSLEVIKSFKGNNHHREASVHLKLSFNDILESWNSYNQITISYQYTCICCFLRHGYQISGVGYCGAISLQCHCCFTQAVLNAELCEECRAVKDYGC